MFFAVILAPHLSLVVFPLSSVTFPLLPLSQLRKLLNRLCPLVKPYTDDRVKAQ